MKVGIDVTKHAVDKNWLIYAADREQQQLSWCFCVHDIERLIKSLEEHS